MSEEPTQPENVEGEYTEEYTVIGATPRTREEAIEIGKTVTERAALKFAILHPRYGRENITDMLISAVRKAGGLTVYKVKVSYWMKEAEQV